MSKSRNKKTSTYITAFLFVTLAASSIYILRPHEGKTLNRPSGGPAPTTNTPPIQSMKNKRTGPTAEITSSNSHLGIVNLEKLNINNITPYQQDDLAFNDEEIWYENTSQKQGLVKSLPADLKNERHIALNRDFITKLSTEKKFSVMIPQTSKAFEFTITNIHTHKNGDRTWQGVHSSGSNNFKIVLTQGASSTYGSIDTPDGNFILQAIGSAGWVASRSTLKQQHDHSESDAVVLILPESIPPLQATQF